jgi:hypothetical protein
MIRSRITVLALVIIALGIFLTASGQGRPDPATLMAAQREAMLKLSFMDGAWRGQAWAITPSGEKRTYRARQGSGSLLRDESQARGRYGLAGRGSDQSQVKRHKH